MRLVSTGEALYQAQLPASVVSDKYLQGSSAEVLERLVAQHLASLAQQNVEGTTFFVTHLDIAGGGDGHVFQFHVLSLNDTPAGTSVDGGAPPALVRVAFFDAGDEGALQARASVALRPAIAALLADAQVDTVSVLQTGIAGASQGKRVCQFVALGVNPVVPTIASAVIGGGNLTITGTEYLSTLPNTHTFITVSGAGVGAPITLTQDEIVAAGGSVIDTQIVVPTAALPGVAPGDTVVVGANAAQTAPFVIT